MRIVIVGDGKMGRAVASLAEARGHDDPRDDRRRRERRRPWRSRAERLTRGATSPSSSPSPTRRRPISSASSRPASPSSPGRRAGGPAAADHGPGRAARRRPAPRRQLLARRASLSPRRAGPGPPLRRAPEFDAFILEEHHAAKLDAPSGTARELQGRASSADPARAVSDHLGARRRHPGTHLVAYDGPLRAGDPGSTWPGAARASRPARWPRPSGCPAIAGSTRSRTCSSESADDRLQGCGTALVTPFTETARSTSWRSARWSSGRSPKASTSSCRAAPPARPRPWTTASANGSWPPSSRPRPGASRSWRAPPATTPAAPSTRPGECAPSASTASSAPRPTTTSPRQEGLDRHFQRRRRRLHPPGLPLQRPRPHRRQPRARPRTTCARHHRCFVQTHPAKRSRSVSFRQGSRRVS